MVYVIHCNRQEFAKILGSFEHLALRAYDVGSKIGLDGASFRSQKIAGPRLARTRTMTYGCRKHVSIFRLDATDGKRGWLGNPRTKWTFLAGKIMENHGTIAGYLPFGKIEPIPSHDLNFFRLV